MLSDFLKAITSGHTIKFTRTLLFFIKECVQNEYCTIASRRLA